MLFPPLVSVLIPAYNPRFFEQALKSAAGQDYRKLEIVVCDDSGGDEIARICERTADPRTRYFRNRRNLGFGGNFTECLNRAKGKYVKFLNDDDVLLASCVSRMVKAFETYGKEVFLLTSRRHAIDEHGTTFDAVPTTPLVEKTTFLDGRVLGNFVLMRGVNYIGEPTTVMFRKRDVDMEAGRLFMLNGTEYTCLADLSLWLRLLNRGGAVYLADPLSLTRIHKDQYQKTPSVAVRCIIERLLLAQDAMALGFLEGADQRKQVMSDVAQLFQTALSSPSWDAESKAQLEKYRRRIPTE